MDEGLSGGGGEDAERQEEGSPEPTRTAEEAKQADALMGWIGSGDMRGQVKMRFDTREEAIAYAERNQLSYQVKDPKVRKIKPKSYADNFRFDRIE